MVLVLPRIGQELPADSDDKKAAPVGQLGVGVKEQDGDTHEQQSHEGGAEH